MASYDIKIVLTVLAVVYLSTESNGFMQFQRRSPFSRGMNQYLWTPTPYRSARYPYINPRYRAQQEPRIQFGDWGRQTDSWGRQAVQRGRQTDHWNRLEDPRVKQADRWGRRDPWGSQTDHWGIQADPRVKQTDQRGRQEDPWGRQTDHWGRQADPRVKQADQRGRQDDPWSRQTDPWDSQADPQVRQTDQGGRQTDSRRREPQMQQPDKTSRRFSSTNHVPRQPQHATPPATEVTRLKVSGYDPEDINITILKDGTIEVKGVHQCNCQENCFEREFERKVQLPRGFDHRTLKARVSDDEYLIIAGVRQQSPALDRISKLIIPVDENGRTNKSKDRISDPHCRGSKRGLKLKKMDAVSRQIVDDVPEDVIEQRYEGEIDEDGVTIEVDN